MVYVLFFCFLSFPISFFVSFSFFYGGGLWCLVYDFYLTTGYWNNFTITSSKEKKTEQDNILDYVVLS